MGRRQHFNRLHPEYPYFRQDGLPDLVYDERTSGYICIYCNGETCGECFGSGYLFLDPEIFHNLVLEIYEMQRIVKLARARRL